MKVLRQFWLHVIKVGDTHLEDLRAWGHDEDYFFSQHGFSVCIFMNSLAVAMQTLEPHVTVSQVARRHGIAASLLFRWRAQLGLGASEKVRLVTVRVEEDGR